MSSHDQRAESLREKCFLSNVLATLPFPQEVSKPPSWTRPRLQCLIPPLCLLFRGIPCLAASHVWPFSVQDVRTDHIHSLFSRKPATNRQPPITNRTLQLTSHESKSARTQHSRTQHFSRFQDHVELLIETSNNWGVELGTGCQAALEAIHDDDAGYDSTHPLSAGTPVQSA